MGRGSARAGRLQLPRVSRARSRGTAAPSRVASASRADRLLLPLLLRIERPLEQGKGRGPRLAVSSLGLRRFPGY